MAISFKGLKPCCVDCDDGKYEIEGGEILHGIGDEVVFQLPYEVTCSYSCVCKRYLECGDKNLNALIRTVIEKSDGQG